MSFEILIQTTLDLRNISICKFTCRTQPQDILVPTVFRFVNWNLSSNQVIIQFRLKKRFSRKIRVLIWSFVCMETLRNSVMMLSKPSRCAFLLWQFKEAVMHINVGRLTNRLFKGQWSENLFWVVHITKYFYDFAFSLENVWVGFWVHQSHQEISFRKQILRK